MSKGLFSTVNYCSYLMNVKTIVVSIYMYLLLYIDEIDLDNGLYTVIICIKFVFKVGLLHTYPSSLPFFGY